MMIMKKFFLCTSCLLLAACGSQQQANQANFTKAVNTYLAERGDLCLAKNTWPIDVTPAEGSSGSRNAVQMPVLERLGLVQASLASVEKNDEQGKTTLQVRRYQLTDSGKKFYLPRPAHARPSGNRYAEAEHDLCAVKLSLDQVVGWETPNRPDRENSNAETVVTYTYKVAAAPWTSDAGARQVFPMVDSIIRGAGVRQLKETFVLGSAGWEAKDL